MQNYSTIFSIAALTGTGVYCMVRCIRLVPRRNRTLSIVSIVATRSLCGLLRWGNFQYGEAAEIMYQITEYLRQYIVLPLINDHMWLNFENYPKIANLHPGYSLLSFAGHLATKLGFSVALLNIVYTIDFIYSAATSLYRGKYYSTGFAIGFAINRYWIGNHSTFFNIPVNDVYNVMYCISIFWAYQRA